MKKLYKIHLLIILLAVLSSFSLLANENSIKATGDDVLPFLKKAPEAIMDRDMSLLDNKVPDKPLANKVKFVVIRDYDHYADSAYWRHITEMSAYRDFAQYVSFSELTNGSINMNDLQMVILPMGDAPLTKPIVTKLKDLIQKKKRLLLTGNAILSYAFHPSSQYKDPDVQDFLLNSLGMQYLGFKLVSRQEGSTIYYWSFTIHGNAEDVIGKGVRKFCNEGFTTYNETWWPLRYPVLGVDVFKSIDTSKYRQCEHFKRFDDDERTDTIVATRTILNDSARVVFFSMGFEAFAGDIPRSTLLERCMIWCTEDIAPDGPQVQCDPLRMDYGYVPIGESVESDMIVKNIGNQPLTIDEIDFFDDADACFVVSKNGFKTGAKKVTLKTGQTYTVTVKFTPKEKKTYEGILTVISNSTYENYKDVNVVGIGGKDITGPKIGTNFKTLINFDTITASRRDVDLYIYNTGETELVVDYFKIIENDDDAFSFPQTINVPFSIAANDSNHTPYKVRFSLRTAQREYKGKIRIHSNASNEADFFIDLVGVVGEPGYVNDGKAGSSDKSFEMKLSSVPANDGSYLKFICGSLQPKNLTIKLYDIQGRELNTLFSGTVQSSENSVNLSGLNLRSGSYTLIAIYGQEKISLPFVFSE